MTGAGPRTRAFLSNPLLAAVVVVLMLIPVALRIYQVEIVGEDIRFVDFDVFYITSQLFRDGMLASAYDPIVMTERQSAMAGVHVFMPWAYPPQFDLLIAPLSLIPRGFAFGLFSLLTFGGYLLVLRRLAGPWFPAVLLAVFPCLLINAPIGQSGLLLGALIGLFCLLTLDGRSAPASGLSLGLLAIKPHLALGIGVAMLAQRRWRVLLWAIAFVAASSLIATWVFGPGIWQAFLHASQAASERMKSGSYKLFRMPSVYSMLLSLGVSPAASLAGHVAVAACGVAAIAAAVLRGWPERRILGVAAVATLMISPYNYDYDMPILGIGLALLARDIVDFSRLAERIALLMSLVYWAGAASFLAIVVNKAGTDAESYKWHSFAALGMLISVALLWRIVLRCPPAPAGQDAA